MQQYLERKSELKKSKYSTTDKNSPLALQVLIIYLCFQSLDVIGRICLSAAYSEYNHIDTRLPNYQWFCAQVVAVLGLAQLPKLVNFVTFRIILLVASLGPQLFLAPVYYTIFDAAPIPWVVYVIAISSSLFSGVLNCIFIFGLLYYLSNLSTGDEKILYYCSFYFIHSLQWVIGSCLGEIFLYYNLSLEQTMMIVALGQIVFSLLFLTILEPRNSRIVRTKEQILSLIELKNSNNAGNCNRNSVPPSNQMIMKQIQLRSLILGQSQVQPQEDLQPEERKSKSDEDLKKTIIANFTLQCFSLDSSALSTIIENNQFAAENNNYYSNLWRTFLVLMRKNMGYFIPLLLVVASLQAFIYLELFNFILKVNPSFQVQEAYIYVGLGNVLGCFAIGLFGEYRDKLIWLIFMMSFMELGYCFAWLSLAMPDVYFFVQIFAAMVGFCISGLTSTIVAFLTYEFYEQIYMVDTLYVLYSMCFGLTCLFFLFGGSSVLHYEMIFAVTQMIGIVSFVTLYFYNAKRTTHQLLEEQKK